MKLNRAILPLLFVVPTIWAQETTRPMTVGAADRAAAASASGYSVHPLGLSNVNRQAMWITGNPKHSHEPSELPVIPPPGYYPGDVSNPGNGPTVETAATHGLYVNCPARCWGKPSNFLHDLFRSDMIKVTDYYTGSSQNKRYSVGIGGLVTGQLPHTLYDADILAIAHLGAAALGTGYDHIYHIYLPPGQDVCVTGTSPLECYSPDNLTTFFFCAYHSSVDFSDIGHVLYTVEPYQNVNGCSVVQPSPNGPLVDSTADVLSHETFETITDPDGTSWLNNFSLDLFGAEIADECQNFDFGYGSVTLNGTKYEIQPEYANLLHGCVFSPFVPPQ